MGIREAKAALQQIRDQRPTVAEFLTVVADAPDITIAELFTFARKMGVASTVRVKQLLDMAPHRESGSVNPPPRSVVKTVESSSESPKWECRTDKGRKAFRAAVRAYMEERAGHWMPNREIQKALDTNASMVLDTLYHWVREGKVATNGQNRAGTLYKWGAKPSADDIARANKHAQKWGRQDEIVPAPPKPKKGKAKKKPK